MVNVDELRMMLKNSYKTLGTWERVAEAYGISKALAWRMVKAGYVPKRMEIRMRLGLPAPARVVSVSGEIPNGSLSLGAQVCEECGRYFIANHPRRRRCFGCSPYKGKKGA